MTRISTQASYHNALSNLFAAQAREADAQRRIGTEKIATDLGGFAGGAETVAALRGSETRLTSFIDAGEIALARLDIQDLTMTQAAEAVTVFRADLANALGADTGTTIVQKAEAAFQAIRNVLNTQHQGQYVFGGGNPNQHPVVPSDLAQLAAAPVDEAFRNGALRVASQVSDTTTLETGFLASELGRETAQILSEIQTYAAAQPGGVLPQRLTAADKAVLEPLLARLDVAARNLTGQTARNGALHTQAKLAIETNAAQLDQLTLLIGKRTDADLAQAATDLRAAGVAVQASVQVINQLRQVSLLDFLR